VAPQTKSKPLNNRIIPLESLVSLLKQLLTVLPTKVTDVYIVAEADGTEAYFAELRNVIPNLKFLNGLERDAIGRDLDHMAHADILIVGKSSFGSLGATLNGNGILFLDGTKPKYHDWATYRTQFIFSWHDYQLRDIVTAISHHDGIRRKMEHYHVTVDG
jgi:hypothetical protein